MFTIKHVGPTGAETIYQSTECTFTPTFADSNTVNSIATSSQRGYVWYKDGAEIKTLEDGIVYVMNDHGATVAKYDLTDAPHAKISLPPGVVGIARGAA